MRACAFLLAVPLALVSGCGGESGPVWPPSVGQMYPDLELKDHNGETVHLSSFRGKVLLIEPIGMT